MILYLIQVLVLCRKFWHLYLHLVDVLVVPLVTGKVVEMVRAQGMLVGAEAVAQYTQAAQYSQKIVEAGAQNKHCLWCSLALCSVLASQYMMDCLSKFLTDCMEAFWSVN